MLALLAVLMLVPAAAAAEPSGAQDVVPLGDTIEAIESLRAAGYGIFDVSHRGLEFSFLFFNLNACPYCARMLDESFREEPNKGLIQTHFDVISLNVLGCIGRTRSLSKAPHLDPMGG